MKLSFVCVVVLKIIFIYIYKKIVLGGYSLSDFIIRKVWEKSIFEIERLVVKGWGRG